MSSGPLITISHYHMNKNKKKKPQKKKVLKPFKTYWIQGWGTYSAETLVCIGGYTHDEVVKIMKKIKAKENIIAEFNKNKKEHDEKWLNGSNDGVLWHHESATLLWIKSWNNTWDNFDTLVHEVSHMVDIVMRDGKKMEGETEACAYQTEYLFKNIRRKIVERMNKRDKVKRNW